MTKVKMVIGSEFNDWDVGETGYIECACRSESDKPRLVVVLGKKVIMCSTYAVEVIED